MSSADLVELIRSLQLVRGRPVLVYRSAIDASTMTPLYRCLRQLGRLPSLDLVLHTTGGSVTTARQIAMLLRDFTEQLQILIPSQARSAGTLLCLSANELVLGPLAELGPIDAQMSSSERPAGDLPGMVSSEDIKAFSAMARDWFGVERTEDRLQVLALVAARFFPTSLSALYRFDLLVRQIADELLQFQLPGDHLADERDRIVNELVTRYHSHDAVLARRDVASLGLRVSSAEPIVEELLWSMIEATTPERDPGTEQVLGVIATAEAQMRNVLRTEAGRQAAGAEWETS